MCQRNVVTENSAPVVGKIEFGPEQRAEIDYRVMMALARKDNERYQYSRGIWDCLYVIFIAAMLAYIAYSYWMAGKE